MKDVKTSKVYITTKKIKQRSMGSMSDGGNKENKIC
jgi:hypothetical protein